MGYGNISESKRCFLLFLLTVEIFSTANGLFFHAKYTDKRCFSQEIPDNTMVTGKYKVELETWNETFGNYSLLPEPLQKNTSEKLNGIWIEVKNSDGSLVMSKLYGMDGRFTFTSYKAGDHLICLAPQGTAPNALEYLRIHFDVNSGGHAIDYEVVKKKEKLTAVQLRVRQLLDHTSQIRYEQNYQRAREMRFRKLSESTDRKIFWFAIVQTILLVVIAYIQVMHLKDFFTQKKLV